MNWKKGTKSELVYSKECYLSTNMRDYGSTLENPVFTFPERDPIARGLQKHQYITLKVNYVDIMNCFYNVTQEMTEITFNGQVGNIPTGNYTIPDLLRVINELIQAVDPNAVMTYNQTKQYIEVVSTANMTWRFKASFADLLGLEPEYANVRSFHGTFTDIRVSNLMITADIGSASILSAGIERDRVLTQSRIALLSRSFPGADFILQTKELKYSLQKGKSLRKLALHLEYPHDKIAKYYGKQWDISLTIEIWDDSVEAKKQKRKALEI
jgi:hypothetical protein